MKFISILNKTNIFLKFCVFYGDYRRVFEPEKMIVNKIVIYYWDDMLKNQ